MKYSATIELEDAPLAPVRVQDRGPLLLAGLRGWFTGAGRDGIAELWRRLGPRLENIAGRVGRVAYGACVDCAGTDTFEYLCGVEVSDFAALPRNYVTLRIPAQACAVFVHRGRASTVRHTVRRIFDDWLPRSGFEHGATGLDTPDLLECYGPGFDPITGCGEIEIWLPVSGRGDVLNCGWRLPSVNACEELQLTNKSGTNFATTAR